MLSSPGKHLPLFTTQANQVHDLGCSLIDKTANTSMEILAINKASWHNKLGVSGVQPSNCTFQ